jgi:2-phosphoglycerate kinase
VTETGEREWKVLVLFGASGTGKSTAAEAIARTRGISALQVDDLRQALQFSGATIPHLNDELYYFLRTPDYPFRPAAELLRAFIGTAEAMVPAVRVAIDTHVVTNAPVVIEGDGVFPGLVNDPVIRSHIERRTVQFCCLVPRSAQELLENMVDRGRGMDHGDMDRAQRQADANLAFGNWLAEESDRLGIPVVRSRPFGNLVDRILIAVSLEVDPGARGVPLFP